jgi:NAD(P)-dependent dehydrogenase (short-subunit alcohol dehydrogenase family)
LLDLEEKIVTTIPIVSPGRVAVITGAAMGIGAAAARRFAREGMRLCLFDRDAAALNRSAATLDAEVQVVVGDVTASGDLTRLCDTAYSAFGEVALLMNNAGIVAGSGPWGDPADWRHQLEVNLLSIVAAQHLFVPRMLEQGGGAAIVNLGSKEGITTPPGNAAYSVAKAGVKVLTEQLAHELRSVQGGKVTAHLLVPGYTWTPMNFPSMDEDGGQKPDEPWTADQVVDYFIGRFARGDFYILCPDNAVTPEMDAKRIRWACDDIVLNRPALSRWHPDWKGRFAAWMSDG